MRRLAVLVRAGIAHSAAQQKGEDALLAAPSPEWPVRRVREAQPAVLEGCWTIRSVRAPDASLSPPSITDAIGVACAIISTAGPSHSSSSPVAGPSHVGSPYACECSPTLAAASLFNANLAFTKQTPGLPASARSVRSLVAGRLSKSTPSGTLRRRRRQQRAAPVRIGRSFSRRRTICSWTTDLSCFSLVRRPSSVHPRAIADSALDVHHREPYVSYSWMRTSP